MTTTLQIGTFPFLTTGPEASIEVIANPQELQVPDGYQVIRFNNTGVCQFIQSTGRRFNKRGYSCPTFDRYEVDIVVIDGEIWGVPGRRITGTLAAYPGTVM